ncbi:MAG: glycosyltransferase [Candidatus Omnitrophica bacterium]|nr:glycosyltransferase [Candidatus Omnitrophota bacterium]
MKLIFIDPILKDESGHEFSYCLKLTKALEEKGFAYQVFGNGEGEALTSKIKNFTPYFTNVVSQVFSAHAANVVSSLCSGIRAAGRFNRQLASCLLPAPHTHDKEIIFFHDLFIFEFFLVARFLLLHRHALAVRRRTFVLFLNFPFQRSSMLLSFFLKLMYRRIHAMVRKAFNLHIVYCASFPVISEAYARLLKTSVTVLPNPIYPLPIAQSRALADLQTKETVTVAYLGSARFNKGFDLFVDALKVMHSAGSVHPAMRCIVQVNAQKQLHADLTVMQASIEKLKQLAQRVSWIDLVFGTISMDEYFSLLAKSDIVVIPHRKEVFQIATSNVFIETVIAGKIPLVNASTSMAYDLQRFNLQGLMFEREDPGSLALAIQRVVQNCHRFKHELKPLQQQLQQVHSVSATVDTLFSLANSS